MSISQLKVLYNLYNKYSKIQHCQNTLFRFLIVVSMVYRFHSIKSNCWTRTGSYNYFVSR